MNKHTLAAASTNPPFFVLQVSYLYLSVRTVITVNGKSFAGLKFHCCSTERQFTGKFSLSTKIINFRGMSRKNWSGQNWSARTNFGCKNWSGRTKLGRPDQNWSRHRLLSLLNISSAMHAYK